MIIKISNFENDIIISDEYVRVLEILDKALFANIAQSVYALCNSQESKEYIVLLDEEKELDFTKTSYFVVDILSIDFNDRKILSKLYSRIKSLIDLDLEIKQKLEIYYRDVFNLLDLTLIELPFEFTYKTELEIEDLFKLYGIKLFNEEQSFIEKVLYLIDLISLLDLCEVLIFCNMKSFFTDEQIEEIYKHIIHNKLHVLLIEGIEAEKVLQNEKKIRIDLEFEDYEVL